jgi:Na+-driven multidrug efflux pump
MFLFLPMFGVVQGMMPIVGFNHGARQLDRARHAVRLSTVVTTIMSFGTTAILIGLPGVLMRVFTNDEALIAMAIPAIRVVVIAFPTVGFQVIAAGMYQALGRPLPAMVLALLRQVILLTPLIVILPRLMGLPGVWVSFPIADGFAAIVTGLMLVPALRALRDRRHGVGPQIPVDPADRSARARTSQAGDTRLPAVGGGWPVFT